VNVSGSSAGITSTTRRFASPRPRIEIVRAPPGGFARLADWIEQQSGLAALLSAANELERGGRLRMVDVRGRGDEA
jgi:hypothetical protein